MTRTLVTADWVLPVTSAPIRDGAVLIDDDRVLGVGSIHDLQSDTAGTTTVEYPGCIITPGLVNAHTHLVLSAAGGLLEPAPFTEWLPRLVSGISVWDDDDRRASAALGAMRCIQSGVTTVGDIAYGIESLDVARDAGVGGVFFWEVLGIESGALFDTLERMRFPLTGSHGSQRDMGGVSPHSVYTSGPKLLAAAHTFASVGDLPFAINLSESGAEVDLTRRGEGALTAVAHRSAHGFTPPGTSPVSYLQSVGALEDATLIHMGYADLDDIALVSAVARGVIACPRSNRFLHNKVADVERLLESGCAVGLGTDSAASNDDLDLMFEARALRDAGIAITDHDLIEMLTLGGATALGIDDRFGGLSHGRQADLAVWHVPSSDDPEGSVVQHGGSHTLEAVMSGGEWRLMSGSYLGDASGVERAAARVSEKMVSAIKHS